MRILPPLLLASLLSTPALGQGSVWVVSPDGGPDVDALEIQGGVDLAADGDLVLVRTGAYEPFVVAGKGITLQGEPGAVVLPQGFGDPDVPSAFDVRDTAADQPVVIAGIDLFMFGATRPAIDVTDALGPVVIDGCFADYLGGYSVARVTRSSSVTFHDAFLQVQVLKPESGPSIDAPGLEAVLSTVTFADSVVAGASGHGVLEVGGATLPPVDGAPGARLRGSTLLALGSSISGGSGGSSFGGCFAPGAGGDGLRVESFAGVPSSARLVGTSVQGGSGASSPAGCPEPDGADGEAVAVVDGTVDVVPATPRTLAVTGPAAPASTLEVLLEGEPGDQALLVFGTQPIAPLFLPGPDVTLLTLPQVTLAAGPLAAGTAALALPTPALPASVGFLGFQVQALFVGGPDDLYLAGPAVAVVVD